MKSMSQVHSRTVAIFFALRLSQMSKKNGVCKAGGRSYRRALGNPAAILSALGFMVLLVFALLVTSVTSPPTGHAAFPGVNGKIAFCSDRDGNFEIYVMNADGSGQTRLTNNPASDCEPAWSADGTKIAFASDRDGNSEIYVMNADGSGQTRLTNNGSFDNSPAWSPDGTKIAFSSHVAGPGPDIFVMNADGTGQTRLTFNGTHSDQPAWSPDGTKIAYFNQMPGGVSEIFRVNPDGTGNINLTNNGGFNSSPDWSPDGTKIAYASGAGFCGPNCEVFVMNANGSSQTNLTNNPASDSQPMWSPDGAMIVFQSNRDEVSGEIYRMNANGSGVTRLTTSPGQDARPAWQPLPNTPPVALCKNVTVNTSSGVCTTPASVNNNSSDPDGDPITLVQSPAGPYNKGTTSVTLTVTDDEGASDSCTATVTVVDIQPPSITCPASQTVECTGSGSAAASFNASASDNCGFASTSCNPASGSTLLLGTTSVLCSATDGSGNSSSCSSSVTVVDTTKPTVSCVQSVNPSGKNVPQASSTNQDGFYKVGASDICSTPTIKIGSFVLANGETIKITQTPGKSGVTLVNTMGPAAIRHFQVGPGDAVLTATDGSGNSSSVTCLVPPPPK